MPGKFVCFHAVGTAVVPPHTWYILYMAYFYTHPVLLEAGSIWHQKVSSFAVQLMAVLPAL